MNNKFENFLNKLKEKINIFFLFFKINKKNKKLKKYLEKKLKKQEKKQRNKYNLQLNINHKKHFTKNFFIILTIIILSIILFIKKTDYFKIKQINIISTDGIANTQILENKLYKNLKNKIIFKINKENIKNNILELQNNIKNIYISKDYPDSINIEINSYPIIFETIILGKKYFITKNGVFIPKKIKIKNINNIELKHIEIEKFPEYKKILKQENLDEILYLKEKLIENIVNLEIKKIIYYKKEREVHFIINNNSRLIFDLNSDIKKLLKQLFVFNNEKINIIKNKFIYLDNRIYGKIYYCPLEEAKKCIKNINYIYQEKLKVVNEINIKK